MPGRPAVLPRGAIDKRSAEADVKLCWEVEHSTASLSRSTS
jgi:hypothetical protein